MREYLEIAWVMLRVFAVLGPFAAAQVLLPMFVHPLFFILSVALFPAAVLALIHAEERWIL